MGKMKQWRREAKKQFDKESGTIVRNGKKNRIRGGISIQKHPAMLGVKWAVLLGRAGIALEVAP